MDWGQCRVKRITPSVALRRRFKCGINRYQTETKRLYKVLEDRLEQQSKASSKAPWIVGDNITIADLACFSWVNWDVWARVNVKGQGVQASRPMVGSYQRQACYSEGLGCPGAV